MTDAAGSPTGVVNPNEEIVVSIPGDRERRRTRVVIGWTAIDLTNSLLRVPGLAVDSAQQIGIGASADAFPVSQTARILDGRLPGNEESAGVNYSHRCPNRQPPDAPRLQSSCERGGEGQRPLTQNPEIEGW
jgi:hypothetical protein